jgi:peptidoglycan/LPS O-acetylase OafA/YrhL
MNNFYSADYLKKINTSRSFIMGIAMCAIMLFHQPFIYDYSTTVFHLFGHWGVDIFFFISGIGISLSLQKNTIQQYFKNRIIRIFPAYLTVVFIWTLLSIWMNINGGG